MSEKASIMGSKLYIYQSAQSIVNTKIILVKNKFESLAYSVSKESRLGDIKEITSRIKDEDSIKDKLIKNGHELSYENAKNYIKDIVGFRIICMYEKDIFTIVDIIRKLGFKIVREKDYVSNPKPSGYRSYHLTVEVPVDLGDSKEKVLVEIQIRTDFMDLWASREHDMIYKTELDKSDLKSISNALVSLSGALNVSQAAMEAARIKELTLKEKNLS